MRNERNILYEILESLPQDGGPIRFNDLRKKVKMSSKTLTEGLLCLKEIGIINRKQVHSTRAIGIEYSISPDFGMIDLYRCIEDKHKNIDQITLVADKLILELFTVYDESEENQKEVIFDAYLSIIIRFLKLCRTLRERSQMAKITNDNYGIDN